MVVDVVVGCGGRSGDCEPRAVGDGVSIRL